MTRPTFLKRGAFGHLKTAGAHVLAAMRHLALALRVVLGHAVAAIIAVTSSSRNGAGDHWRLCSGALHA